MSASSSKELVLKWVGIEEGSSVFRFPDERLRLAKSEVLLFLPVLRTRCLEGLSSPRDLPLAARRCLAAGIEVIPRKNKSS